MDANCTAPSDYTEIQPFCAQALISASVSACVLTCVREKLILLWLVHRKVNAHADIRTTQGIKKGKKDNSHVLFL